MIKASAVRKWTKQNNISFRFVKQGGSFYRALKFLCLGLVLLNTACSTLGTSPHNRDAMSGRNPLSIAVRDPNTWLPAAAAVLIAATGTDHDISQWASEHTPVYGSQRSAQDAGDTIRGVLAASAVTTSLVSPGQGDGLTGGRVGNLLKAGTSAFTISELTNTLKDSTGRTRPNTVDSRSFPSSHSSASSTYATIAAYRVNELSISPGSRQAWTIGLHSLAGAAAWARVEANAHYPTDVLIGYALGNFTTVVLEELFRTPDLPVQLGFDVDQKNDRYQIIFNMRF